MEDKARINGKAVVSVVLGLLSLTTPMIGIVLAVIGVVVSIIAIKEIGKTTMRGRGFATVGLIISIYGIVHQLSSTFNLFDNWTL